MSMHRIPLTKLEEDGLRAHGLDIGTPSQLSDVFRQGIKWALDQATKQNSPFIDFNKPLETLAGEPVKYIGGDVCEYKQARMCINHYTGQPYGPSPYPGLTIRNKVIDFNTTLEEAIAILPEPVGEPSPKDKAHLDALERHLDSLGKETVLTQLEAIEKLNRHLSYQTGIPYNHSEENSLVVHHVKNASTPGEK